MKRPAAAMKRPAARQGARKVGLKRPAAKAAKKWGRENPDFIDLYSAQLGEATPEEIRKQIRQWFGASVPDMDGLECSLSDRSSSGGAKLVWRIKCLSCAECDWSGRATFERGQLRIRGKGVDAHTDFLRTHTDKV